MLDYKEFFRNWTLLFAWLSFAWLRLYGQDGSLDGSFQSPLFKVPVSIIAVESDSRILYVVAEDNSRFSIGRLTSTGGAVATLNLGDGPQTITSAIDVGTIHIPGATNPATINVVKPLANGQFLVGGTFSHFNKVARKLLVRLDANGAVDPSFNPANGFKGDNISSIVVADGGRIYVAGKFSKFGNVDRNVGLVRLNPDGTLDSSFGDSTISFGATVSGFTLQPDGRALIDAAYANASFQATYQVYRLGLNGGLDGGFVSGAGTPVTPAPLWHALLPNGQILVTGGSGFYNGVAVNKTLFRLQSDGTVDGAFPGLSLALSNVGGLVSRFLPAANGAVYMGGAFDAVNGQIRHGLARLKADGTLDPSFVPAVYVIPSPEALVLQPDGKILAVSTVIVGAEVKYNIVRLNGSGGTPPLGLQLGQLKLLSGGRFQLPVTGGPTTVIIEASANLTSWQRLATNSVLNGVVSFTDPSANLSSTHYYRLLTPP